MLCIIPVRYQFYNSLSVIINKTEPTVNRSLIKIKNKKCINIYIIGTYMNLCI